jgi:hypothetical protein
MTVSRSNALILALAATGVFCGAAMADEKATGQFRPVKEAELPKGFPGYTPVGTVEVKQYPAYRKASVEGAGGFWTLFGHIKQNEVAMTAPVEMTYGDAEKPRVQNMAFLYERPDQGATGKQGSVEVVDVPAMTVVSIGCRGWRTEQAVNEARDRLLEWLDENRDTYTAAGSLRVMGYNSPFVPRDKQFFEVQVPVSAK